MIWPEIFITGVPPYKADDPLIKKIACADALSGWSCSIMEKPPENFGKGMAAIGGILGIAPTLDNVMAYAKEHFPKEA